MKTIYIIISVLVALTLSSCDEISESRAMKIANLQEGFNSAFYAPLRINELESFVISDDSRYVYDIEGIIKRTKNDEEYHSGNYLDGTDFKARDLDGSRVYVITDYYRRRTKGKLSNCAGCKFCYDKYKEKGLLNYTHTEPNDLDICKAKVSLTPEGKKYIIQYYHIPEDFKPILEPMGDENNDQVLIKFAEKKYTKATKIFESPHKAEFYLDYYYHLTPFGEALYGEISSKPTFKALAKYEKEGNIWRLKSLEEMRRNGIKQEF